MTVIFVSAFVLNAVWENLHSLLYLNYKGAEITEIILLRAALADALMITAMSLPFIFFQSFKKQEWLILAIGFILAISIEWYGLGTNRWVYKHLMPIIPVVYVGLTPAIQLGLLGYLSLKLQDRIVGSNNVPRIDETGLIGRSKSTTKSLNTPRQ